MLVWLVLSLCVNDLKKLLHWKPRIGLQGVGGWWDETGFIFIIDAGVHAQIQNEGATVFNILESGP